jgi:AbrB family looped-hinge helix DNA binding protein
MPSSTLTSKGQITVPKEIRDRLKLKTGQKLDFRIAEEGQVILHPRNRDVRLLKGVVKSPRRKPVSVREMNETIAEAAAGL